MDDNKIFITLGSQKFQFNIPFAFEDGGTRVIHYTPETYEPKN